LTDLIHQQLQQVRVQGESCKRLLRQLLKLLYLGIRSIVSAKTSSSDTGLVHLLPQVGVLGESCCQCLTRQLHRRLLLLRKLLTPLHNASIHKTSIHDASIHYTWSHGSLLEQVVGWLLSLPFAFVAVATFQFHGICTIAPIFGSLTTFAVSVWVVARRIHMSGGIDVARH
jgi:hypothetical protein